MKATESRTILLYTGAVACAGVLPDMYYKHFLLFHDALTILNRADLCGDEETLQYADNLLKRFVDGYETLFGSKFLAYNFHLLLYVVEDCGKYGTLNEFSAFPFGNYMRIMRGLVRKGDQPLQQLMRRYAEIDALNAKCAANRSADWSHRSGEGPKTKHNDHSTLVVLRLDKFTLNCKDGKNGCVLVDDYDGYGNKVGEAVVECECIKKSTIYIVSGMHVRDGRWSLQHVLAKMLKLPYNDGKIVTLPILHTYGATVTREK
ncbi:hypothetical protein QAD02_021486 [Eretmocerus hayati]|uniref:Uncharacterized protein n=1 Tax=Eretmocerus hayati TaxID=131215 RepID=A0ACC2PRS1_9HYME|nr:hypothetical protein QAD02_021486 [Eretmocerus hayati]